LNPLELAKAPIPTSSASVTFLPNLQDFKLALPSARFALPLFPHQVADLKLRRPEAALPLHPLSVTPLRECPLSCVSQNNGPARSGFSSSFHLCVNARSLCVFSSPPSSCTNESLSCCFGNSKCYFHFQFPPGRFSSFWAELPTENSGFTTFP